jgi:hypothetical protein
VDHSCCCAVTAGLLSSSAAATLSNSLRRISAWTKSTGIVAGGPEWEAAGEGGVGRECRGPAAARWAAAVFGTGSIIGLATGGLIAGETHHSHNSTPKTWRSSNTVTLEYAERPCIVIVG